jgi:hypothetical protein
MNNAESLQIQMQKLRYKNEQFFKTAEPSIYALIHEKKVTQSDLKIIPSEQNESIEIDVIEKGQARYFGCGIQYCEKEAEKFAKQMFPGSDFPNFKGADADIFSFDRVGSIHFRKLIHSLEENIEIEEKTTLPDFYPLLVILGVGLGFHIESILKNRDVSSLIIYEYKLDRFLTSLYTLDWENIYSYFDIDKGHSIQIILATEDNYIAQYGMLWNELVHYTPHFPFTTLFYNHLTDATHKKIISGIQDNITTFLQQWGHYDDEINQYNNARQNLLQGAKGFHPSTFRVNRNIPVAVIGAGPSLDDRIEQIKKHRDKLIVISCGTTIGTLYKYNIKPDFHVELESDYVVYEAISKSTTEEYRKGITLLAAVQVNPLCLSLFENSLVYFKDSTALSQLFLNNDNDIVTSTTPTCTNAGCAIATQLGFKNIFLFGTDFGFISKDKHHASGSVYYQDEEDISFVLSEANNFEKEKTVETVSIHGEKMETKPMYFTAQKRLEECIKYAHKRDMKVYNCSDGASIKNSNWISNDKFNSILEKITLSINPKDLVKEIYKNSKKVSAVQIDEKSELLLEVITSIFDTINKRKSNDNTLLSVSKNIFIINNIISRHVKIKFGYMQFFLRGQIWLYLSIYYNFCLKCKNKDDMGKIISICENWLVEHQDILTTEMKKILFHEMSLQDDPWINETVENENFIKSNK